MKETRITMGMPVTIEVLDNQVTPGDLQAVFAWFQAVDNRFSTYKRNSEIARLNRGELAEADASPEMREVLSLAAQTKAETGGYFDIERGGRRDPSGIVKGWAIQSAAHLLVERGLQNFYVDAGGDIQTSGLNAQGQPWHVGVRHPFEPEHIMKVLALTNNGVATSGTYIRGEHIYSRSVDSDAALVSLTVIGPTVYDADRFATAAFAMGHAGLAFLESRPNFEAYGVNSRGQAFFTSQFHQYVSHETN